MLVRITPHNRVALVTGASRGIGAACATALIHDGWRVAFCGRGRASLEKVIAGAGDPFADISSRAHAVVADVTDPSAIDAMFAEVVSKFGRVDLLFNNAGIFPKHQAIDAIALEDWRIAVDTNLTGMFLCLQHAFRQMKRQTPRGGRIINNGSLAAYSPRPESIAYSATKHGVLGLTRAASLDGRAHDISVGQIDIGNAATDMTAHTEQGAMQADGSLKPERRLDVAHVANAVVGMANLPLEANIQYLTILPTTMPFVGRG